MRAPDIFTAVFLMLAFATNNAIAGVRLIFPEDASGDAIRTTAGGFWSAVADGDEAKAEGFCIKGAQPANFISISINNVSQSNQLLKAVGDSFEGAKDTSSISEAFYYQREADRAKTSILAIMDDVAVMPKTTSRFNLGLELKRVDGVWKISSFATEPSAWASFEMKIVASFGPVASRAVPFVKDGSLEDLAALKEWRTRELRSAEIRIFDEDDARHKVATKPSGAQRGPSVASCGDLQKLLGNSIRSPEAVHLVSNFPSVPMLRQTLSRTSLESSDTGISIYFVSSDSRVQLVELNGREDGSDSIYPDELPQHLKFGETRAQVEAALGRPAKSGGGNYAKYWEQYPQQGFYLSYATEKTRDPDNRLSAIEFRSPSPVVLEAKTDAASKDPGLSFRLVADPASKDDPAVEFLDYAAGVKGKSPLAVQRETLFDANDIVLLRTGLLHKTQIQFRLTVEAGKKLKEFTSAHLGRSIAMVFEGRVLSVEEIRTAIAADFTVNCGDLTADQTSDLVDQLHASVFRLPD